MLGLSVLYRSKRFDYIVSGINRGDNLGLHVVYSGTVAGAREGAMRTGAVGVAVSLDSYSRTADYSEAARLTAELVTSIHDAPGLTETLRGCVLNVNVPNLPRTHIKGVKLTTPGLSCTQAGGSESRVLAATAVTMQMTMMRLAGRIPTRMATGDTTAPSPTASTNSRSRTPARGSSGPPGPPEEPTTARGRAERDGFGTSPVPPGKTTARATINER